MKSLNGVMRELEAIESVDNVSIEIDDSRNRFVEVRSSNELSEQQTTEIADRFDARVSSRGTNPFGDYVYQFK